MKKSREKLRKNPEGVYNVISGIFHEATPGDTPKGISGGINEEDPGKVNGESILVSIPGRILEKILE